MTDHIAAFAEFLNRLSYHHHDRADAVTREILHIFDSSDDVPGEIKALLRDEFDRLAARARHA